MTIIKKFELVEPNKGFSKKYVCIIVVSLFVLMLAEIWASNNDVEYGAKLEKLSLLSKTLTRDNQLLANEIALDESLNNIASKSAELGFSSSESIQYIR